MRRLILACLVLALCVPSLQARRKTEKAGEIKDNVFTDKKYGYSLTLSEGWKSKVLPNKGNFRLVLTQKNYETPSYFMSAPEYTKVPRIIVYADTSSYDPMTFLDSLIDESYSSPQKNEILKEFEILNNQVVEEGTERDKTRTRKRRTITVAGERAAYWEGKVEYRKYVSTSASATAGTRVYGSYGGGVVVAKHGNTVVVFHVISELVFFPSIMQEAMGMIKTLQWTDEKTKEKKK